jgi:hypothetical protein
MRSDVLEDDYEHEEMEGGEYPGEADFVLPAVHVNEYGWGPTPDNVPEQYKVSAQTHASSCRSRWGRWSMRGGEAGRGVPCSKGPGVRC